MANEKRLIDANALIEKLSRMIDYCKNDSKVNGLTALFQVGDAIMDCPTVDAVEVVHGRWINNKDDYPSCDKCGYMPQYDPMIDDIYCSNYCPNCGAKMDGGNEND